MDIVVVDDTAKPGMLPFIEHARALRQVRLVPIGAAGIRIARREEGGQRALDDRMRAKDLNLG